MPEIQYHLSQRLLRGRATCGLYLCLLLLIPAVSYAEEASKPLWELSLGGLGMHGPAYPGSSITDTNLLLLPFPIYRGKFLRLGEDTEKPVRGRLLEGDRWQLDLDADFNFGANSEDIDRRRGMPDLDPLVEVGPEITWRLTADEMSAGKLFLALQVHGAASFDSLSPKWRGVSAAPELRYVRNFERSGQRLKIRLTPTFASHDYMNYFYAVSPLYATPDRPAYEASGGYLGTTLGVSWHQPLSNRLQVRLGARMQFLGGAENEASPLFEDTTGQSLYIAFLYSFWQSERTVKSDD